MADTVAVPLRKLAKLLPDTIASTVIGVSVGDDGVTHRGGYGGPCRRQGCSPTSVALGDLRPSKSCELCMRTHALASLHATYGPVLAAVLELEHQRTRASKVTGGDTRAILRHQSVVQAALAQLERATKRQSSPEERVPMPGRDGARLDSIVDDAVAELGRLKLLLRSPAEQRVLLDKIRVEVVGLEHSSFVLDETPALLAIRPYDPGDWNKIVHGLAEQASVGANPLVLAVPRYVADYVRSLTGSGRAHLHPSADVRGLPDNVIDVAVRLWDPDSSGPFATLQGAVQAAACI